MPAALGLHSKIHRNAPGSPDPLMILAEDDDEIRAALEGIFRADGFEVWSARDGYELVDLLEQARDTNQLPYILVTDHRMPGYSGVEIAEALRRNGWPIPVILITAYGSDFDEDRVRADAVFHKPFDADDLRTAVFYWMQQRDPAPTQPED